MSSYKSRTMIANVLTNLAPLSGASEDYCRGLIVGVVSALMGEGMTYAEAWGIIKSHLPADYRREGIPVNFRD